MEIQGIFLKRQHEEIIAALIKRMFLLLDSNEKSIEGYSVSNALESVSIVVHDQLRVKITIEPLPKKIPREPKPKAPLQVVTQEPDIEGHVCIPSEKP